MIQISTLSKQPVGSAEGQVLYKLRWKKFLIPLFILACPPVEKNNTNMTCHHTNQVHPKKKQQKHRSYSTSNLVLKQDISQETSKVAKTQEKILQPHD